ncbi:hypothetical protein BHM03_00037885 [Ensete ventricosum]|nr:hypothetical protein BHM03_00037885 [Ensete ventricosum]
MPAWGCVARLSVCEAPFGAGTRYKSSPVPSQSSTTLSVASIYHVAYCYSRLRHRLCRVLGYPSGDFRSTTILSSSEGTTPVESGAVEALAVV